MIINNKVSKKLNKILDNQMNKVHLHFLHLKRIKLEVNLSKIRLWINQIKAVFKEFVIEVEN